MRIVLATGNRGKIREIKQILSDLDLEVLSAEDFDSFPSPRETGKTFLENALIKARAAYRHASVPALADDSGIEVEYLDGGPGIESARYGGLDLDDAGRYRHLLKEMKGVPEKQRGARFRCVMALYPAAQLAGKVEEGSYLAGADDQEAFVTEGYLYGRIAERPCGRGGFGYDPVFYIPEEGMTAAEIGPKRKNRISHRYRALIEMKNILVARCGVRLRAAGG
jgi:XTP/dITP diphosphohydrolase